MDILVPRTAILLACATARELWQGPKVGSPRITNFRPSAQPQKFETITVTISYKNGQLLRLRVILAPPELSIRGAGQKDRSSGDENGIWKIHHSSPDVVSYELYQWSISTKTLLSI